MNTAENSTTDPSAVEVSATDAVAPVAEPETVTDASPVDSAQREASEVAEAEQVESSKNTETTDAVTPADAVGSVDSEAAVAPEPVEAELAEPETPKPAPIADETLLAAVDVARDALLKVTPASSIGEPTGHIVEDDHVLSLLFATTLPGYPGWNWTVTLARVADGAPMVLETELMPGENALLAPEWVPWSERLADYRATQEAAEAESRALAEAAAELDDEEDDEDEGYSILHAGDLDGVDVDEIDQSDGSDEDASDEDESDDDESDDDDDESDDDDDESDDDDDDESEDDDDESDDDEAERSY